MVDPALNKDEDGWWIATHPAFPGVVEQEQDEDGASQLFKAALTFTVGSMLEEGEPLPAGFVPCPQCDATGMQEDPKVHYLSEDGKEFLGYGLEECGLCEGVRIVDSTDPWIKKILSDYD